MRRRTIIAIVAIGVIGIFALLLSFSNGPRTTQSSTTFTTAWQVPNIFGTAVAYGANTLVGSNGRSFVTYNYHTGQVASLSNDNLTGDLTNIDKPLVVSSDKRFIVFHVSLAATGTALYNQLAAAGLDTTQSYWWLYDTTTHAFHNFPQTTIAVRLQGDNGYALTKGYSPQTILTFSLANFTQTASISVPPCGNFFVVKDGFLLQDGSTVLNTTDGVVSTSFLSSTTVLHISADQTSALISTKTSDNHTQLSLLNLTTNKQTTITTDAGAQTVWDASNDVLFGNTEMSSNRLTLSYYNASNNQTTPITLAGGAAAITAVRSLLDANTIITANNTNNYLVGANIAAMPQPNNNYNTTITVGAQSVTLQYFPSETAFIVVLNSAAAAAEQAAIYQQLQTNHLNPNLLEIRFTQFTPPSGAGR